MVSFLKLVRYPNLIMVSLTMFLTKYVLINSFIQLSFLTHFQFFLLVTSVIFITASGYIVNDILDVKADKINKPNKVFIQNAISKKSAWISYFALNLLGLVFGIYVSFLTEKPLYSVVFIVTILALFFYSKYLKQLPLIGNLLVSFLVAFPIFLVFHFNFSNGFILSQPNKKLNVNSIITGYFIFAFLTTLVREIIKDIEDTNGDYALKMKTLPILIGRKRANRVALGVTFLLIIVLIVVIKEYFVNSLVFLVYGLVFILFPLFYFSYKLCNAKTLQHHHFLSNFIKLIMLFGILSMLLFKL